MKEFTFRKFADLKPTTLRKMSSFKVFFKDFPYLLFFSMNTFLKEHICNGCLRTSVLLFWDIYKTRNTGMVNRMQGICRTRGMFTRIPRNLYQDSGECYYFKIPGNVDEDSGEYSRGFQGILKKIPGNVLENSGKCSKRFRGMLVKIPGNAQEDSKECLRGFRGMLKKIPGNVSKDSGKC